MEPRLSFVLLGKFKSLLTRNSKGKVCVRASSVPASAASLTCLVNRLTESPLASTSPLNMTLIQFVFVGFSSESVTVPAISTFVNVTKSFYDDYMKPYH